MNAKNDFGNTALHVAVENFDSKELNGLVQSAINLNAQNDAGDTALSKAAELGYTDAVELLIQSGSDVNLANYFGETPLHKAALAGNLDTVKALAKHGAIVNACDNHAQTPADYATFRGGELGAKAFEDAISTNSKDSMTAKLDGGRINDLIRRVLGESALQDTNAGAFNGASSGVTQRGGEASKTAAILT